MMRKPRRVAIMLDLDRLFKWHTRIFSGTQLYANEQGWYSIMDECVEQTLALRKDFQTPYDGVIARVTKKLEYMTTRLNIPVVNVWMATPVRKPIPSVYPDYAAVGILYAEHLLSRGHIRFAGMICQHSLGHVLLLKAFVKRLREAGFSCACSSLPLLNPESRNWPQVEAAIVKSMDTWKPPLGVFMGWEINGRLLAQLCKSRGWRVPQDVSIIAGTNEEAFCEGLHPTLSSVEIGFERVGYEAAKLLNQLMDGKKPPSEPILVQPTGVVARESTDFFSSDDAVVSAALKFISENYQKDICREDVARAVNMETRTLQRRFNRYLKRPIATEIRRVRLERAKRELAQGNRSIAEIARDAGFGQNIRMYEVFMRELGVSPTQYRKERNSALLRPTTIR